MNNSPVPFEDLPQRSSPPWLVIFATGGLALAWLLMVQFKTDDAPPVKPGGGDVGLRYQPDKDVPYVESSSRSDAVGVAGERSALVRRKAKEILPDGTIVYEEVDAEAQRIDDERERVLQEKVARANAVTRSDRRVDAKAAQEAMKPVQVSGLSQEVIDEMKASGQFQKMLDQQYERMIQRLRKGYGSEGGPSREQIEQMHQEGILQF